MDNWRRFFALAIFIIAVEAFSETRQASDQFTGNTNIRKRARHVSQNQYSWHVFVRSVKCSGVFVEKRWVLTSAACVLHWKTKFSSAGWFPLENTFESNQATMFIRVGNHHVDFEIPGEDTVAVLETLVYPEYNASTSSGNIGLLYLARDVMLPNGREVPQVSLPDGKSLSSLSFTADLNAKVMGWGHESSRETPFRTLRENDVALTSTGVCLQRFEEGRDRKIWLCASAGIKGMCSIDRGSPLVIKRNNSWFVMGIYSRGEPCSSGEKDAALFSRIDSKVLKWIQKLFKAKDKPQCRQEGHTVLDTPERLLSNKVKNNAPLCDNALEEAWYRLEINGFPTEIPTSCPAIGSCGTHAQIWLRPGGHPNFGEEKESSACVAWDGMERICCMWQIPVRVTHCGDFMVYWLKRTDGCSMAYCTKEAARVPCGPGKIGYVPKCKVRGLYPTLAGPPKISPVVPPDKHLASRSVHLLCTYDIEDPGPYRVGYRVTWFKVMRFLGGKPGKLVLLTNTTVETAAVISFESADFQLGDTIACGVKTFYSESPYLTSPSFSSRDFYVGVKVEPPFLVVSEDHKVKEITISLSVPLVCPPSDPNCTIQIPLHLIPVASGTQSLLTQDLALSICEVTLRPQTCSRRDCGRKLVRLAAVSDFILDGDRRTRVIIAPARSQSPLWKSHDPPDAFILTKDIKTFRCYIFTDSYIKTLAGRYYHIPAVTTAFIMYKSLTRPFEIHSRFWPCSKSGNPAICACGVAVREGDDVIEIDMCDGRFTETSVQVSVKSRLHLAKGLRITESDSGKRYTVYFPSGSFVRADVFDWGLNVYVQSPGRDLGHVTGLCGKEGISGSSEDSDEGLPREMTGIQQWRLKDGKSLFDYKPVLERYHRTEKFFCLCDLNDTIQKKRKCDAQGKICELKCRRHQHVLWSKVTRERDITKRVELLQARRILEQRLNTSVELNLPAANLFDQPKALPPQQSDSLLAVLVVNSYCKRLLTDTPLGRACKPVVGQRSLDQLLRICIRDMRYTGVSSMAWGAVAVLKDSCEELVIKNVSAWEKSSSNHQLAPSESVTNTFCPRLCSDRGRCINGTCQCRRGYISDDCSVQTRTPPQLINLHGDRKCNTRNFHCKQVQIVGEGFLNSRNLKCSFTAITFHHNKQVLVERKSFLSKATFESYRGVTCKLPMSHGSHPALSGYQVRLSNDAKLWSQPLPFLIYDGHCVTCNDRNVQCDIKIDTCLIDGHCRRSGESNIQDPCKWCSPKVSQTEWTDIDCQPGTCESSTCVHGVCIDTTMGNYFCFCDVGFTGPSCDITENPCVLNPCANGTCVPDVDNKLRCICPPGHTGEHCSEKINPCTPNPCVNGSCVVRESQFECSCEEGYTGHFCEKKLPTCLCQQGTCFPSEGAFVCICPRDFTGEFCEIPVDICSLLPCKNGTCILENDNAKCRCVPGYTGDLCDIAISSCRSMPCVNGACLDEDDHFRCTCSANFTGDLCDITVSPCSSSPCVHGNCVVDNNTLEFRCFCYSDYTGKFCETHVSLCKSNPCVFGKCEKNGDNFTCTCAENYTGVLCDSRVDPCVGRTCGYGRCVEEKGLRTCLCFPGYSGEFCEHKTDPCASNPCLYGSCFEDGNTSSCLCEFGFTGKTCDQEINFTSNGSVSSNRTELLSNKKANCSDCKFSADDTVNSNTTTLQTKNCSAHCFNIIYFYPNISFNIIYYCANTLVNDCLNLCKNIYFLENSSCLQTKCNNTTDECKRVLMFGFKVENSTDNRTLGESTFKCLNGNYSINGSTFLILDGNCSSSSFRGSIESRSCNKISVEINYSNSNQCSIRCSKNEEDGFVILALYNCTDLLQNKRVNRHATDLCVSCSGVLINGTFLCTCLAVSNSNLCQEEVDSWKSNLSLHGNCTIVDDAFECIFHEGCSGPFCNQTSGNYTDDLCVHGRCSIKDGNFSCECFRGFTCSLCVEPIRNCESNSCEHGTCSLSRTGFVCDCFNGFHGKTRKETIDPCDPDPCLYGNCSSSVEGIQCTCQAGYRGKTCNETDFCESSPCIHGNCNSKENGFDCSCPEGFSGITCNQRQSPCLFNLCKHGKCFIEETGKLSCQCFRGYQGPLCENALDYCLTDPCSNGRCINTGGGFRCLCYRGFSGIRCHIRDFCLSNPCANGTCQSASNSFKCVCHEGFTGNTCNKTIDHCQSNPCVHGRCLNIEETYECKCQRGFTGKNCNDSLNHCQPNPCIYGDCINLIHSFKCKCYDGFGGVFCDSKFVDPCRANPCKSGRCVPVQVVARIGPLYQCVCDEGFTGTFCASNVDPCKNNPCKHGICIATDSKDFQCSCFEGFTGNKCGTVIDHCLPSPCKYGSCVNKNASFECLCNLGYTGNVCDQEVDLCQRNPCKQGSCKQRYNSTECLCHSGYTGDFCETRIDYCKPNPCNHGICAAGLSSFQCICQRGHSGDVCDRKVNLCKPNPCKHGTCYSHYSSWFNCRCNLGYTGKLCDREINMCKPDPCKNGTCINLGMSFRCRCTSGFHGRLCHKIDSCQSQPCRHGICVTSTNSFTCQCPKTYTGRYCEIKIDPCQPNRCRHGQCHRVKGFFRCICVKGYSGKHCQVWNDPCSPHPCNNGRCITRGHQYTCQCSQGFNGKHCETDVDECLSRPCFAGVECVNYPGSFRCGSCPVGFTGSGTQCEKISADDCAQLLCFKDVACMRKGRKYQCGNCPRGYTGNGVTCTELNACSSNPCHRLVLCFTDKASHEGFRCGPCPTGFTGNGITCTSMCPFPCPFGMTCVSHLMCRCPKGFYGTGCRKPFCRAGCYNGGKCIKPDVCRCGKGFGGLSCLTPICQPPCSSRGKCVGPGKCQCLHGFTGSRCQDRRCLVTCLNGGSCVGPYVCRCMPGYSGQRCEIAPCSQRCQNGGWCVTPNTCKCLPAYVGNRCQYPVCRPPCINGGHCIRPNVCMCPRTWMGDRCQMPVCHLPCLNGGRCARPNQCTCLSGYVGIMCERAICGQKCLNGGQCVRPGVCACPFGFTGRRCERRDSWYDSNRRR